MSLQEPARRRLPILLWTLVVAFLLLLPGDEIPDPGRWERLDKLTHALLFAVHFALMARAFPAPRREGRELAVAALASGLYALLLETAQLWIPGRGWEWWDVVAGLAGIAVAALLVARRHARLRAAS